VALVYTAQQPIAGGDPAQIARGFLFVWAAVAPFAIAVIGVVRRRSR